MVQWFLGFKIVSQLLKLLFVVSFNNISAGIFKFFSVFES